MVNYFQREEEKIPREIQEKEKSVDLLEEEHDQIRTTMDGLEKQIADLNIELSEVREQQRRCQARALAVKTQREYQAVQRESDIAKKRRGELEGQIKECLEEKEVIEDSYLEVESRIGDQAKILKKERQSADNRLKKIQGEREDLEKHFLEVPRDLGDLWKRNHFDVRMIGCKNLCQVL